MKMRLKLFKILVLKCSQRVKIMVNILNPRFMVLTYKSKCVCVYICTENTVCKVLGIALLLCSTVLCDGVYFACQISDLPDVNLDAREVLMNYQACTVKFF